MRYWPNPAHKRETTEAGPPEWHPDKSPCPDDLSVAERDELLKSSVPVAPDNECARRYALRRSASGLELYDLKFTRIVDGEPEFHGHPASRVPARILRKFRDQGELSPAEYRRLIKSFGCI